MDLSSNLYVPVLMDVKRGVPKLSKDGRIIILYVISENIKDCRDMAVELMRTGQSWAGLAKQGWRIKPCQLIADERDIESGRYDKEGEPL